MVAAAHAMVVGAEVQLVAPLGREPVGLGKQRIIGVQEHAQLPRLVDGPVDERHRRGLRGRTRDVGVGVAQPHLAHRLRVRIGGEQPVAAEPGIGAGEQRQVDPLQAGQRRAGIVDVVQPHLQRAAAQGEYDVEAQSRVDRDGVPSLASAGPNRDVEFVPGLVGAVDAQPAAGSARAEGAPATPVDVAAEQRQVAMQRYRQLVALQDYFGIVHRRPGYPEAKMTETAAGLLDHAQRPRRGGTPGRSSGTRSPRRSHGGAPGVSAVEDSSRR